MIRLREDTPRDRPDWCAFSAEPWTRGSDALTDALSAAALRLPEGGRAVFPPADAGRSAMESLELRILRDELGGAADAFFGNACGCVLEKRAGLVSARPLFDRPHREFLLGCVHV